jgi:Glyoxalase-like domain
MEWQLTIDANDPARLVRFWAPVLGYLPQPPPAGFATWNDWYRSVGVPEDELDLTGDGTDRIMDPTGAGPRIWFQVVPETKAGKNRLHLDIYPGGRDRSVPLALRRERVEAFVAGLVTTGASVQRRYPADFPASGADVEGYFVVLLDPEGNEFCVG